MFKGADKIGDPNVLTALLRHARVHIRTVVKHDVIIIVAMATAVF
jgi:hypothetical protein